MLSMITAFSLLIVLGLGVIQAHSHENCRFRNILDEMNVSKSCVDNYCFPRIIWVYWSEEKPPEFVAEIIENNKRSVGNFTFCMLGPRNITKFLDMDMNDLNFMSLHPANQADHIRIRLLEKYGGIWVDISTFLNSASELEWFVSESVSSRSQFTSFEFNWENVKLEFSFIGAPENSGFMTEFRKEMDIVLSKGQKQFSDEMCPLLLSAGVKVPKVICDPYYFMDLAFLSAYSRNPTSESSVLLLPENRSNYRLFAECSYGGACSILRYLRDPAVRSYPFIKFQSGSRLYLGEYIKRARENDTQRVKELDAELMQLLAQGE